MPWFSAIPIDWETDGQAIATANKHAALQTAFSLIDTLTNRLKPDSVGQYKGSGLSDQSVFRVQLSAQLIKTDDGLDVHVGVNRPGKIRVTLKHLTEDGTGRERTCNVEPGGGTAHFENLDEGVHRILVAPAASALLSTLPPVTDYVLALRA